MMVSTRQVTAESLGSGEFTRMQPGIAGSRVF